MKVYAISDLHLSINNPKPMDIFGPVWDGYLDAIEKSWNKKVSDNDIVLISGDISWAMKFKDALPDLEYISKLKGHKVLIKGNHDYWWNSISEIRANLKNKTYAIQNDAIKIGKVVIGGSRGWVLPDNFKTEQDEKIFRRECLRMELSLRNMEHLCEEGDIRIFMTHYPPLNIKRQANALSELYLKYGVDKVVYGHLHSYDKGYKLKFTKNKIDYYLTSCDLVGNKLIKIAEVED